MDCIFCKISSGEIESNKEYEDSKMVVFHDSDPQAPVHLLAIPRVHIESLDRVNADNCDLISHIFEKLPNILGNLGLEGNYRLVSNCGKRAGQTVNHLHFHILGGREMRWPPG